jgi:hypothetical protein
MDDKKRTISQLRTRLNDNGLEQWIRDFAETLPLGTRRQQLLERADGMSRHKREILDLIKDVKDS